MVAQGLKMLTTVCRVLIPAKQKLQKYIENVTWVQIKNTKHIQQLRVYFKGNFKSAQSDWFNNGSALHW